MKNNSPTCTAVFVFDDMVVCGVAVESGKLARVSVAFADLPSILA